MVDDIRCFGPAIRFSTEIYEAYNSIFRQCSIFSNHLAPSHDISFKFASLEHVKYVFSGGYCSVSTAPNLMVWRNTSASKTCDIFSPSPSETSLWKVSGQLVTMNGDTVKIGAWVMARDTQKNLVIGRIHKLLICTADDTVRRCQDRQVVILETFLCSDICHAEFGWPVLRRPAGADITEHGIQSMTVLQAKDVQFKISVQHDCRLGQCKPTVMRNERQERQETTREVKLISHTDDDHFIINLTGLHNFTEVCRVLPHELTQQYGWWMTESRSTRICPEKRGKFV
ncbi:hypothetical protein BDZ89DRAFT_1151736 [Hymenopellis radicata]|nr:hypothetical protein BDZ89DRAFT_1151736 [Hymenopellis radicata]